MGAGLADQHETMLYIWTASAISVMCSVMTAILSDRSCHRGDRVRCRHPRRRGERPTRRYLADPYFSSIRTWL